MSRPDAADAGRIDHARDNAMIDWFAHATYICYLLLRGNSINSINNYGFGGSGRKRHCRLENMLGPGR